MGLPGALWGDPGSPKTPPERPRDGPWQPKNIDFHLVFLRFRGSVRFLSSSGSNNQRRRHREQSNTSHSGGEETKKKRGPQKGRFSAEQTQQNHRFPLWGFSHVRKTRRFCARVSAANNNKNQNRGPKVVVRHLLGAPRGPLEDHWLFKGRFLQRENTIFKNMNKTT